MFEAYAHGDFKRADVIYALAKGLPVPAYGYIPTGIAAEIAALGLERPSEQSNPDHACENNPYASKPCLNSLQVWRDFAERYQLEDNPDNARLFQAYSEGDYRLGDQLMAEAKGVSLEQLHEAAGVPSFVYCSKCIAASSCPNTAVSGRR